MNAKRLNQLQRLGDGFKQTLPYQEGKEEILANLTSELLIINGNLYHFEDILDCSLKVSKEEDVQATEFSRAIYTTKTNTGSLIGRSLLGGAIAGPAGAIVGGMTATKTTTTNDDFTPKYVDDAFMTLTVNNITHPTEQIHIGSDRTEIANVESFFKIILSQEKGQIAKQFADKEACITELYSKSIDKFLSVNINETIMYNENKTMMETRNDYKQLLVNKPDSYEIEFISKVMDSACDADFLYHHHGDYLYSTYLNDSRGFLSLIRTEKDSTKQSQLISVFEKATDIIVHKLDGGYDNDRPYSFRLYIAEGDIIEAELGTAFSDMALSMWKKGIKLHHDEAYGFKNVDFSTTMQKIQKYDSSYVEPQKAKADMGCMVLLSALIIITVTIALL